MDESNEVFAQEAAKQQQGITEEQFNALSDEELENSMIVEEPADQATNMKATKEKSKSSDKSRKQRPRRNTRSAKRPRRVLSEKEIEEEKRKAKEKAREKENERDKEKDKEKQKRQAEYNPLASMITRNKSVTGFADKSTIETLGSRQLNRLRIGNVLETYKDCLPSRSKRKPIYLSQPDSGKDKGLER